MKAKTYKRIKEMLEREDRLRDQLRFVDIDNPQHARMEKTILLAVRARKRIEKDESR